MSGRDHPCLFRDAPAIRQEFFTNRGPVILLLSRKHDRRRHGRVQDMSLVEQMEMVQMRPVQMFPVKHVHVLTVERGEVMVMVQGVQMVRMCGEKLTAFQRFEGHVASSNRLRGRFQSAS